MGLGCAVVGGRPGGARGAGGVLLGVQYPELWRKEAKKMRVEYQGAGELWSTGMRVAH